MKPLWSARGRPPKERPEWLTWEGLKAWARGEEVKAQHTARSQDLYALEERTGIEIDPASWSAKESLIYTTRKIRLKRGIAFYAEVVLPEEKEALLPGETAEPWGGERHYVRMSRVRAVEWPHAQGGNITLALLTPAFCGGWRPRALAGAALAAAAVDGPFSVSGWDFANGGPKPARFGIDAGSVFLLEGGGVLPESLTDSSEDALAGYGMYVKGTWNYVE
jgi:CRISPR-associated protein Cmr3